LQYFIIFSKCENYRNTLVYGKHTKIHEFYYFVALIEIFVASLDSTAQTGHANGADWQEHIYQKVISVIYCSFMP
jgi:hypothetical protein